MNDFCSKALEILNKLNSFENSDAKKVAMNFLVDGQAVGYIMPYVADALKNYPDTFTIEEKKVFLNSSLITTKERTIAVEKVLLDMRERKIFECLKGWRDEHYEVKVMFSTPSLFTVERAGANLFGIKSYACNVNGYVKKDGEYFLWIAKRSLTKQTFPGMLDNLAGGGLTAGLGIVENAKKELQEEANVVESMTHRIRPVGAVSYAYEEIEGISIEADFVFDIKLPADFTPSNNDGEVERFTLMSIDQVKEAIVRDEFMPSSAAITLGFLQRKGLLSPDKMEQYLDLTSKFYCQYF